MNRFYDWLYWRLFGNGFRLPRAQLVGNSRLAKGEGAMTQIMIDVDRTRDTLISLNCIGTAAGSRRWSAKNINTTQNNPNLISPLPPPWRYRCRHIG